jgi:hypothetical protein
MKEGPITDPEFLGLLREISADPRSGLMKLATQGLHRRIGLHEPPISGGEPFLTRAERHLIREHREQVARWLFELAKRACLEAPQVETAVYRGAFAGWSPVMTQRAAITQRAFLLEVVPSDGAAARTLEEFLPARVEEDRGYGHACAFASFRLVPRDSVRNLHAVAAFALGKRREGFLVLEEILSHRPTDWYRSVALQNKACERAEEGADEEAKALYLEAHRIQPARPEPVVGLLVLGLLSGDREGTLSAARVLPEAGAEACSREHVEILMVRARTGRLRVSTQCSRFSMRIRDELPSAAAQVAQAYAELGKRGNTLR